MSTDNLLPKCGPNCGLPRDHYGPHSNQSDGPIKSWIEERRAIHAAAPGEAWSNYGTPPFEVYDSTKYADGDMGEVLAETRALKVSHAITDAHNMFPRALDALNAVLELCDEWDREVSIPGVPGVECDESFKVRLVIQKAIEGAIDD